MAAGVAYLDPAPAVFEAPAGGHEEDSLAITERYRIR